MASLCFCKRKYFYHKEGNYLPMITTNFYLKSFCFGTEDSFLQLLFEDHILHISQWNYGSCFQKVKNKRISHYFCMLTNLTFPGLFASLDAGISASLISWNYTIFSRLKLREDSHLFPSNKLSKSHVLVFFLVFFSSHKIC